MTPSDDVTLKLRQLIKKNKRKSLDVASDRYWVINVQTV